LKQHILYKRHKNTSKSGGLTLLRDRRWTTGPCLYLWYPQYGFVVLKSAASFIPFFQLYLVPIDASGRSPKLMKDEFVVERHRCG